MLALLRVFLDPRLYAAPGPGSRDAAVPQPNYIPEQANGQSNYAQQNYAGAPTAYAAPASYMSSAAGDAGAPYGQDPAYAEHAPKMGYDQSQYQTNPYDQAGTQSDGQLAQRTGFDASIHTNGSAALDMYSNPYLSGQNAGAIDQNPYAAQTPHDPNAPQG